MDKPGAVIAAEALLKMIATQSRNADPLTAREREVAGLLADALSNRQIADHLVLSERTVEGHVRSILAKTGLTSRGALIRRILQERHSGI
jgi:DNA-binding NarL/FixJ family response regulator